jgi:hypothetical protein
MAEFTAEHSPTLFRADHGSALDDVHWIDLVTRAGALIETAVHLTPFSIVVNRGVYAIRTAYGFAQSRLRANVGVVLDYGDSGDVSPGHAVD